MAINKEELLFKKVFAGKASTDNSTAYFSETAITDARLSVFSKDICGGCSSGNTKASCILSKFNIAQVSSSYSISALNLLQ